MKKAVLTLHAREQIEQRLLMSEETLREILDNDIVVTTGGETKSNRYHKVFYSLMNKMCFVAIQDSKTGHIVTVLPIDYHQNIAWVISYDAQLMAKDLMFAYEQEKKEKEARLLHEKRMRIQALQAPLAFRVHGYLEDDIGSINDCVFICSWKDISLKADLENLINDQNFLEYLFLRLHKKRTALEVKGNIVIKRLCINIGQRGEKTLFHLPALEWLFWIKKQKQNTHKKTEKPHCSLIHKPHQIMTSEAQFVMKIAGKLETLAGQQVQDINLGEWQTSLSIENIITDQTFIKEIKKRIGTLIKRFEECTVRVISIKESHANSLYFFELPH